jgi:hypothetical protein
MDGIESAQRYFRAWRRRDAALSGTCECGAALHSIA